ncbi:MAG TPA: hypothetical protein VKT51_08815 [Candidatus Eremiobacteraceae bacterium]|nr:hypothetical protein [Candidatus Eremiobacteraceae bacterium]
MSLDDPRSHRSEFLLKVYDTYNAEIGRHFGLAWQAVSIFAASLLAVATSAIHSDVLPTWIVASLYIVLVTWAIQVVLDASFWYNRNLVVIANIERQFLSDDDDRNIQWYFKTHRPTNKPITFMRSLLLFLLVTALIVVTFYFVFPALAGQSCFYNMARNYVPALVLVLAIAVLRGFSQEKNREYTDFLTHAPGVDRGAPKFPAPEHDFSERPGLSPLAKAVAWLEDTLLTWIGTSLRR